ncbi:MAG: glycosyltransferase family 39 protein [Pseudomonadota bacterium]
MAIKLNDQEQHKSPSTVFADLSANDTRWQSWFLIILLSVFSVRIAVLIFAKHDLGPDESQYWFWSQTPAFGYFSKPPMIAWVIGTTTSILGEGEAAIRLSAPTFHCVTAFLLFLLGRSLFTAETGFWSGVSWLMLPGVSVSSAIISTDALLLCFWTLALLFTSRISAGLDQTDTNEFPLRDCLLLGGAIGFGLLSKYAMVYFVLGLVLLILTQPRFRQKAFVLPIVWSMALGVLLLSPNILWNARNDFQTLSHTAANANWTSNPFHPLELLEFLGAQFGVIGPLMMLIVLSSIPFAIRILREKVNANRDWRYAFLLAFTLPPITIVSAQALLSRAHANWAATSYPSAVVLAIAVLLMIRRRQADASSTQTPVVPFSKNILPASTGLNVAIFALFSLMLIVPNLADTLHLGGVFKTVRGWKTHAEAISALAEDYDAIACDDRDCMGALLYYGYTDKPVFALETNLKIENHYEAFLPLEDRSEDRLLFASFFSNGETAQARFSEITRVGQSKVQIAPNVSRTLYLFEIDE